MNLPTLSKAVRPLWNHARGIVARAVVRLVDDERRAQELQIEVLKRELRQVERFQNYGFTSVPKPGAEALVVFVGGNREHGVVVAVEDRRYRLKGLEGGEVAMYTDEGDSIVFRRGRVIEITSPTVTISGDLIVAGDVSDGVRSMAADRELYNAHVHAENGGSGPTNPPVPLM